MADKEQGDNWTAIAGVGSVVLSNQQTTLRRIVFPGTFVGTVTFYNSDTVAGTAAGNQIISLGLPVTSTPQTITLNANCTNGLVYAASGTPTMNVSWS